MGRGKFITIEGGEGVGKSTQIALLRQYLESRAIKAVMTREPGGTARAERIREILLERTSEPMPPMCELLLMFAARATHLAHVIEPELAQGKWVVCDRFTDATYAYQGNGRGMNIAHIETLETLVQGALRPDLTILLDVHLDISSARARSRNETLQAVDRFESEQREFFERVREGYLSRARAEPARFAVIDAGGEPDTIAKSIERALDKFIEGRP